MAEYKGLYNETGLDADYINVSILVCDSAELTNTVSQLTLHNTTISDIQTSPTRTLTVPNTAGNTQFVLESSVNTFTNTNTFSSGAIVEGYDVADTFNEHEHALSTGVYNGGILSIGNSTDNFNISDGAGIIVQNTTNPHTITPITWTNKTNITVSDINTQLITFVSIDGSGNVLQSSSKPSNTLCRSQIYLGVVVHTNKTTITGFNQQQQFINTPALQLKDFLEAIGPILNIDGNVISANGSNLIINKSSGVILAYGANYYNSANDPHKLTLAAYTGTTTAFEYRMINGDNYYTNIVPAVIDPNYYESSAGVRTSVPVNKFTIQRVYTFTSNNVKLQYGQTVYNSLAAAKDNLRLDSFTTEASIKANGVLIAYIIIKQGTTNLSNATDCFIINCGKFEGSVSSAGGTTLQLSYDNSNVAEILTDSTRGALTLKRGSASDNDNVLEVLDGSGNQKFSVNGYGNIYTGATPGKLCIIDSSGNINYQTAHGDISNDASGLFTLPDINSDVGTYGDYANVSVITVNAKGQITAASQTPIIPSAVSPITPGSGVYSVLAYDSADGTLLSDPSYFRYDFENKNLVFPLASTGIAYMSGGNLITKSLVNGDLSGIRQIGYGVSGSLGWGYLANLSGLYNICIGHSAGYNGVAGDTSGSNNVLIGSNVGSSLRGDNNVCLGTYAGNSLSGNKNICIGNQAGVNVLNGHDNIYIGSLGVSGDNNVMRLGMSGTHTNVYMSLSGQSVMCISGTSVISRQIVNADVDSGALIDLIKINCNNNFVPSVSNTYNLGSLGSKWATAYIGQIINTVISCSGTIYTDNLNSYDGGAITLGATLVGNISGFATYAEQVVINSAPASGTYNIPFLTGLFYGPINTDADFTYTTSTDTLAATNVRAAGLEEKTPAAGITLTGKINGSLSGAAYTASGITVNSTVSGTYYPVCVSSISGVGLTVRDYSGFSINTANGTLTATTYNGNLSGSHNGYNTSSANAVSTIVNRDNSGNFAANIITGTLSGSATTATTAFNLSGVVNSASTGTTQTQGDNSTKIATTAYVDAFWSQSIIIHCSYFPNATNLGDYTVGTRYNMFNTLSGTSGSYTFYCPVSSTWKYTWDGYTNTNTGIGNLFINGSSVGTKDFYNAAPAGVRRWDVSGITLNAGSNTIQIYNNNKNASSTGYVVFGVNMMILTRLT